MGNKLNLDKIQAVFYLQKHIVYQNSSYKTWAKIQSFILLSSDRWKFQTFLSQLEFHFESVSRSLQYRCFPNPRGGIDNALEIISLEKLCSKNWNICTFPLYQIWKLEFGIYIHRKVANTSIFETEFISWKGLYKVTSVMQLFIVSSHFKGRKIQFQLVFI